MGFVHQKREPEPSDHYWHGTFAKDCFNLLRILQSASPTPRNKQPHSPSPCMQNTSDSVLKKRCRAEYENRMQTISRRSAKIIFAQSSVACRSSTKLSTHNLARNTPTKLPSNYKRKTVHFHKCWLSTIIMDYFPHFSKYESRENFSDEYSDRTPPQR